MNLEIYNKLRNVPNEAKKVIAAGRLKGLTDIKPMWRIEKLTEVFGVCGIGWKTEIIDKQIIEGANGEKIAVVDIKLYILKNGTWSEPIYGTGGSKLVSKENNGLYTNDECFKMAYTDALSVACKSLGMGADVYWGDSKYDTDVEITKEDALAFTFTSGKHTGEKLNEVPKSYLEWTLENINNPKLHKMIYLATGIEKLTEDEKKEKLNLTKEIQDLVFEKNIDLEDIKEVYNINSLSDLTLADARKLKGELNG